MSEQSEQINELVAALAKVQGELEGANKSSDNPFFKSKYADLYECIQAAKEPLAKHNLAVIQTMEPCDNGIIIVTILAHSSGQWIKGKIKMNPKKNDDQGLGSSITYGRRYSFAAIVGLAQKDDDGNASCEGGKTEEKKPTNQQKSAAEKAFDTWHKWIDDTGKASKNLDEFEQEISTVSKELSKFQGKFKTDIGRLIEDTKKRFQEEAAE